MHSSLKIVCNKGGFDVFEGLYITAKMMFTHCSQFHNCIPYTDKKSFTFNLQSHVTTFFYQNRVYFPLILAEPPFDWFINLLRPSTFSYQKENSIITAVQSVTIQPISSMKMCSEKINIYFESLIQSTTLPRIILRSFYLPCAITTSGFYFRN